MIQPSTLSVPPHHRSGGSGRKTEGAPLQNGIRVLLSSVGGSGGHTILARPEMFFPGIPAGYQEPSQFGTVPYWTVPHTHGHPSGRNGSEHDRAFVLRTAYSSIEDDDRILRISSPRFPAVTRLSKGLDARERHAGITVRAAHRLFGATPGSQLTLRVCRL